MVENIHSDKPIEDPSLRVHRSGAAKMEINGQLEDRIYKSLDKSVKQECTQELTQIQGVISAEKVIKKLDQDRDAQHKPTLSDKEKQRVEQDVEQFKTEKMKEIKKEWKELNQNKPTQKEQDDFVKSGAGSERVISYNKAAKDLYSQAKILRGEHELKTKYERKMPVLEEEKHSDSSLKKNVKAEDKYDKFALAMEVDERGEPRHIKLTPGDHHCFMMVDGMKRQYDIHIPKSYDPDKPMPMIMAFHGMGEGPNPEKVGGQFGYESRLNLREDCITVFPFAASGHIMGNKEGLIMTPLPDNWKIPSWNSPGTGLTPTLPGYDDNHFVDKLVHDLPQQVAVDKERIRAVGWSEGGMFLNHYICKHPDTFAASSIICTTMNGLEVAPDKPVNMQIILAGKDLELPGHGGKGLMTSFTDRAEDSKPYLLEPFWLGVNDSPKTQVMNYHTNFRDVTNSYNPETNTTVEVVRIPLAMHAVDGASYEGAPVKEDPLYGDKWGWPHVGESLNRKNFDVTENGFMPFFKDKTLHGKREIVIDLKAKLDLKSPENDQQVYIGPMDPVDK